MGSPENRESSLAKDCLAASCCCVERTGSDWGITWSCWKLTDWRGGKDNSTVRQCNPNKTFTYCSLYGKTKPRWGRIPSTFLWHSDECDWSSKVCRSSSRVQTFMDTSNWFQSQKSLHGLRLMTTFFFQFSRGVQQRAMKNHGWEQNLCAAHNTN